MLCTYDACQSKFFPNPKNLVAKVNDFKLNSTWLIFVFVSMNQNPNITQVHLRKGPMSGGTLVTAGGTNLNFGSTVEMVVGPNSSQAQIVW